MAGQTATPDRCGAECLGEPRRCLRQASPGTAEAAVITRPLGRQLEHLAGTLVGSKCARQPEIRAVNPSRRSKAHRHRNGATVIDTMILRHFEISPTSARKRGRSAFDRDKLKHMITAIADSSVQQRKTPTAMPPPKAIEAVSIAPYATLAFGREIFRIPFG